jgi:hypothetical protein
MGTLTYGAIQREITIDDHLLAHVEAVTLARLRRSNSFALRWTEKDEVGDGRRTIWIHEAADLYFEYDGKGPDQPDRDLLDKLAVAADSNNGINLSFDASDADWTAPQG